MVATATFGFFIIPVVIVQLGITFFIDWLQTLPFSDGANMVISGITDFFQNIDYNAIGNGIADFINQIGSLFG